MAGIYLHIPFCKQACHYCNFHFSTSLRPENDFLNALLKEIELRKDYTGDQTIETIYFGGGTPSLLNNQHIRDILERLNTCFSISPLAEITLEANPDDISPEKLRSWKSSGINRLSIGVQSFFDHDLKWMNRAHLAAQAIDSIKLSQDAGIDNLSIDLIYGMPELTDKNWVSNLERAIDLSIPHLSCYALTVETGTALEFMIRKKKSSNISTDDQARQFGIMTEMLQNKGYQHYEISNFALSGKTSRHNSSYWHGETYLGLGPSAHSFNGSTRQWNISNNTLYIQALQEHRLPFEIEYLDDKKKYNEYIMTSIRTSEGTDLSFVGLKFGTDLLRQLEKSLPDLVKKGWAETRHDRIILTQSGKLFADGIASDLFVI